MADDLLLKFPAETAGVGLTVPPAYVTQSTGNIEFRRQPLPFSMSGSFDRAGGNRFSIPYRIRSYDFFKAIPCILGFSSTVGAPAGGLLRRLPIRDEQGLGMVAVRIPSYKFHGSSTIKPGPGTAPCYDDTLNSRTPDPTSNLFRDDPYDSSIAANRFDTGTFDFQAIKQTRYCVLNVEFAHVPYNCITDAVIQSGGNPFGANSEKYRYMWAEFNSSVEYTTSKALFLKYGATASGTLPGQPCGTEGGYIRPTGELVVHWIGVPADAVAALFSKFDSEIVAGKSLPRYGGVNNATFNINVFTTAVPFAAETLLFMSCKPELRFQPHGYIEYDLHYHFNYRAGGWNNFLTNRSATLEPVVKSVDSSPPYRLIDFEQLFVAA